MKKRYDARAAEAWLTKWFVSRAKVSADTKKIIGDSMRDTDYFKAGWLTSMEVVEFITEIEQEFDIQFSDRDLQDRRFVTIGGLAELILQNAALANEKQVI